MTLLHEAFFFVARLLLAGMFVYAAIHNVMNWQGSLQLMQRKNIPYPNLLLSGATGLKFFAGLAVIFNIFAVAGALALAGFTLIANIIFHDFWNKKEREFQMELLFFLVNMSIIGGLLLVIMQR